MSKQFFTRLMILSCSLMLAILILASLAKARGRSEGEILANAENDDSSEKLKVSVQPLLTFSDKAVIQGGGSKLVRTDEGVYMSLHSFGLTPGTAVTAWWVFFNNPKKCATNPCSVADLSNPDAEPSLVNATGRIVGPDGTADFGAFKSVGDTTGAVFGPGLLKPFKAEIHLVVRTHGTALLESPELLVEQLGTFNGGCPPNTCANLQISIHPR